MIHPIIRFIGLRARQIKMALITLTLLLMSSLALASWPITEFKVFLGEPWSFKGENASYVGPLRALEDLIGLLDTEDNRERLNVPAATIDEIERYLGEVALRFSEMGFRPPMLEPIVERRDGTKAYVVFIYDFDQGTPAYYSSDCDGGGLRRLLRVDSLHNPNGATIRNDASGLVTDKGYQDLAHELFHAVQAAYPLDRENCNLGDWISEGTAQAIGVDIARELRGIKPVNEPRFWGMRPYDKPLWVADNLEHPFKDNAYQSASFWRYIGEKAALAGGIPGVDFGPPDYRYLNDFFNSSLTGTASENTELEWINQQLFDLDEVGIGLSRLYPYFVSTYAGYVNHRLQSMNLSSLAARTEWLGQSFGHCPYLEANADGKPASYPLKLGKVASGCWLLGSTIQAPIAIQVTAQGVPAEQLAALAVGTHNGQVVDKPDIVTIGEQVLAYWLFRVDNVPGEQTVFIISNVAEKPEETQPLNIEVNVTVSGWNSSLLTPQ